MTFSYQAAMLRAMLALIWIGCAGFLAFRGWDPLKLHYLTLFFRETPFFLLDIAAGFSRLFSQGLKELGYVAVLLLAAAGSGRLVLAPFSPPLSRLTRCSMYLALGFVILSYSTFLLGLLQLYTSAGMIMAWLILGLSAGAALWQLRTSIVLIRQAHFNWPDAGLLCFTGILAVFLLAKALWPAIHVDAIIYHLGIPNYYLQEGGLRYIPTDMYSGFPFFTEMLYVLAMLAEGQKSAQCTCVLFFLVSGLCVYAFMNDFIGKRCARIAAVLFLVTPCFMESSLVSGNDMTLVFYVLMAVLSFFLWCRHNRPTILLVLTGVFAGICLSTKYTALTFMPLLLAAGLIADALQRKERLGAQFLKRAAVCAGAALIVFLPWCLKNILATGNPLYPALYPVLGGADMSPEMYKVIMGLAYAATAGNALSSAINNLQSIFLFTPGLFITCGPLGNAGLGLLFFLPVLLLLRKVPAVIKALFCAAVIFFLAWTMFSGIIRFFYPGMTVLVIISAYVIDAGTGQFPKFLQPFFIGAAAACLLLNCGMGFYQVNMLTMTYGTQFLHETDDAYLRRHMDVNREALLDSYPANCYINKNIGPNACVLIIGDAQHLYINRRHQYTYLSATTPYGPFKKFSGDYHAMSDALKQNGITHILYNPAELMRLQSMGVVAWKREDTPLIEGFLKSAYIRELYATRGPVSDVKVYKLI